MRFYDGKEWALTKIEARVFALLEADGFSVTVNKRFVSKDYVTIEKDDFSYDWVLPLDTALEPKLYVPLVEQNFEMMKQLSQKEGI